MTTSFTDWESGLYLQHHGIDGQKWGRRRFQNADGSLTAEGEQRYGNKHQQKADKKKNKKEKKHVGIVKKAIAAKVAYNIAKNSKGKTRAQKAVKAALLYKIGKKILS